MNYGKIDLIVERLEKLHMMKPEVESKEILAVTQAYRIMRLEFVCPNCGSTDTFNTRLEQFCNHCKNFY